MEMLRGTYTHTITVRSHNQAQNKDSCIICFRLYLEPTLYILVLTWSSVTVRVLLVVFLVLPHPVQLNATAVNDGTADNKQ